MRGACGLWIALAAAALSGCGPAAMLDGLADGGRGRAVAVSQGDLITLQDGRRLRLAGVEAPSAGEPHSEAAREALERLVLDQDIELFLDAPGRNGAAQVRTLSGRRWVQGELLSAGAARVRTSAAERAMAKPMLDLEARARIARRGLWALPVYRVALPGEIGPATEGLQLVEGRVGHVEHAGGGLRFDLGDGLPIEAPARVETAFALAGYPADSLVGKLVRVRGRVSNLRMRIDGPEAVELLKAPGP